jgi:UDP-GlcNAc:undecaprenyl-phosphate GlcNAc-1-phosphate transferase
MIAGTGTGGITQQDCAPEDGDGGPEGTQGMGYQWGGWAVTMATVFAVAAAALLCLAAEPIARWFKLFDLPDGIRKIHPRKTPLVGGVAVIVPALATASWFAASSDFLPFYVTVVVAVGASLLLGLFDDRRHIRPHWRLFISLLLAAGVFALTPALEVTFFRFSFIKSAIFLGGVDWIFSIVCLIGLQNAINMADGKNGIVLGLSLFWCANMAIFAPLHLLPLLAALAAALAVVLAFNLKGRLFLGDSGTYALSFLFGILAIYIYDIGFHRLPADLVALWFLIPVVDCLRLMIKRTIAGQSPFSSDRNHLHHILYDRMRWRYGLVVYLGIAGLPGLLASIWPETTMMWASAALVSYVVVLLLPAGESAKAAVSG